MSAPPYLAYLRILVPVDSLAAHERARWTAYAAKAPARGELERRQFAQSVIRLAGHPPAAVPAVESTDALVLTVDGTLYVCPQQPRMQAWHGLGAGVDHVDPALTTLPGATVPQSLRDLAAADFGRYVEDGGDPRLYTRVARWRVPVAWFVLFDPSDRQLRLDDERVLRYRTPMSAARRRGAIALRTVRRHLADVEVAQDVEQVGRWLEEFHPRSLVELDYGGLVDLVGDDHLRSDDSVADVAAGLEALAEGDAGTAAAAYQRLATRWGRVALMSRSS